MSHHAQPTSANPGQQDYISDPFEEQMKRDHAAFLERCRIGDLRTVVAALREWSEVESVPGQDDFDLILARLEALTYAD